ncbi:uncharacterized protein COLE_07136 [Cutaneotrichosporon oleaginosum]|uniref:uncharacterized protein n=1 Tax=Cutaneotrichosporon oleaginosum TaxID=879819 RepID=UPI001324E533|nr:hypothetical protein COLE_07136 [Cutaneotrichosporon oleaginosum]
MADTPPHSPRPLPGSRDRTPELTTKREKRHREDDDNDRDRRSKRRDDDRDRSRERRRRYDDDEDDDRERRRRRERERDRDDDRRRDHSRSRDRDRRRDRSRSREYRHRSRSRDRSRDHRRPRDDSRERERARLRAMTREEKERERERRDREMREERRELARREGREYNSPRRRSLSREASQLLEEVDAEARSVFVSQIAARLTSQDLGHFFEDMLGRGSVRDARIITDKGRRSKGMGYVTLRSPDLVNKALNLSGKVVVGIPILVGLTPADSYEGMSLKAVIASIRGQRETQKELHASRPRGPRYPPITPGAIPSSIDPNAHAGAAIPYHRLYITKLSDTLSRDDLRQVFDPFGEIEFVDLHVDHAGASKGTAYVQFAELSAAQMALDAMNDFELAGEKIQVQPVEERNAQFENMEGDQRRGGRLDAAGRMELMKKLARTDDASRPRVAPPPKPEAQRPTHFLMVSNMFNPDEETERNWDTDLAEDIQDEVNAKYGRVARIKVDKMSQGDVYIEFADLNGSERARVGLQDRWFGGRKLQAQFISEALFKAHL